MQLTPQFTFLISLTWNNLALPLIGDKLVLVSEILVKIIVPFMGKRCASMIMSTTLIRRILLALAAVLARLPRVPRELLAQVRPGRVRPVLDGELGDHVRAGLRHGDGVPVAGTVLPVLPGLLGHHQRECSPRADACFQPACDLVANPQVSVAFLSISDMPSFYRYGCVGSAC